MALSDRREIGTRAIRLTPTRSRDRIAICVAVAALAALLAGSGCGNGGSEAELEGKIAYTSNRNSDGSFEIFVMDADGSNQTRLTDSPSSFDDRADFSPDGSKIAFGSNRGGNFEIYTMNADGSNVTRVTNNPATPPCASRPNPACGDRFPAFSPDGSKIAFERDREGASEIYTIDLSGGDLTRLTNRPADVDTQPDFSPDGSQIVFASTRGGQSRLWVMDADGSNPTRLTDGPADGFPKFSPDGSKITFTSYGASGYASSDIFTVDADGSNRTNLTHNADYEITSTFSLDSSKIAFYSSRGPGGNIWVMDADGSNPTNLSVEGHAPSWVETEPTPAELIDSVMTLGLAAGIERSLLAKLEGAQRAIDEGDSAGACTRLASFINQVEAQRGNQIGEEQADQLIADAEAIRASLGCS